MEQIVTSPKGKQFPIQINMPTNLPFTVNGQIGYFLDNDHLNKFMTTN